MLVFLDEDVIWLIVIFLLFHEDNRFE